MTAHPTIHDVARVAGVGIGTVSRVLNEHPSVRPATREKVLAAIAQLHFKPNPIARSMISKRTDAIGVVVPFFTRPFQIEVLRGVQNALSRAQKELVLYNVENDTQRDHYFSEIPMHRRVDGMLIISLPPSDSVVQSFHDVGLPTILIDAYSPHVTSLVVNNVEGAYQAVKSLLDKGHRHIGFINGIIEGNFKFNQANDRLIGFHRALGEAGLPFEPNMIVEGEWNRQAGRDAARSLLTQNPRPTAIFAASDLQAIGVLETAQSLNIAVPSELAVIGFDGLEIAELLNLSTVQQPMLQMGEIGTTQLLAHIGNPQLPPELIRLSTTLVERLTTQHQISERPQEVG
jgi:LacI family transcriptional regulator/LacI family repressor for deo operon, udp, cdd, tsx, nupC, and nupG